MCMTKCEHLVNGLSYVRMSLFVMDMLHVAAGCPSMGVGTVYLYWPVMNVYMNCSVSVSGKHVMRCYI